MQSLSGVGLRTAAFLLFALIAFSALVEAESLRLFDVKVSGNCTGKPVIVSVKDLFDNEPVRAQVRFTINRAGAWEETFFNWSDATNGSVSYYPTEAGEYLIDVQRPGYVPFEKRWSVEYCPECRSDSECADTQFCTGGRCTDITGACGRAANHRWVAYECCSDEGCAGNEVCSENRCARLTGRCGRAENHTWYGYDCCADADCGTGKSCVDHACVVVYECTTDAECPLEKRCLGNRCIALTGECGYASNHSWVSYECCGDEVCPSHYCLDNHTCSPVPRGAVTVSPATGGGGLCGGAAAILLGAFLFIVMRR